MIYALYFVNHDLFPQKYIFSYLSTYHFQSLSGVVHLEDDTGRNKKMIKSCSKKKVTVGGVYKVAPELAGRSLSHCFVYLANQKK